MRYTVALGDMNTQGLRGVQGRVYGGVFCDGKAAQLGNSQGEWEGVTGRDEVVNALVARGITALVLFGGIRFLLACCASLRRCARVAINRGASVWVRRLDAFSGKVLIAELRLALS